MYHVEHDAFDPSYRDLCFAAILDSPHLGNSPLGPEFVNTKGFSLVFRRENLPLVLKDHPYLVTYLQKVTFPSCNAFYINPLVLGSGSRVDQHVDCRLLSERQVRIIPNLVSIWYVRFDANVEGGELVLQIAPDKIATLRPVTNDLVHFRGNLIHHVGELRTPTLRVTVVCEQYNLPDDIVTFFPEYALILDSDVAPRVGPVDARVTQA